MKYSLSMILYIGLILLSSCNGDNQEAEVVSADLLVAGKEIEVSGGASQDTIRVEANGEWSVSTQTTWIHIISPRAGRGSGSQDLIFEVDASTQTASRPGTLTIRTTDGIQRIITVTQRAGDIILDPQPRTTMVFTYTGGTQTLDVTSNAQWTATSNVAWLTINGEREVTAEGNQQLNIQVSTNNDSEKKTGTIVFKDLDNRATPVTIPVEVGGRTPMLFVTEPDNVPATGGRTDLGVRSNFNWILNLRREPKGDNVWAYIEGEGQRQMYEGVANSEALTVGIYLEPNITEDKRTVYVSVQTISDGSNNLTEERTITQAAGTRPVVSNVAYRDTTHTTATITFQQSTSTFEITESGACYSTSESEARDGKGTHVKGTAQHETVTVNLTGLNPNTRYYVRGYATNVVGTAYGADVISFKTRKVPGSGDNETPEVE